MADKSLIEWTDTTWQIVTGCSVVSPGCTHCYAMRLAGGRMRHHPSRAGLTIDTKAGPVWNGQVRFNENWLTQPLHWKTPRKIFVAAHGDLFHDGVTDAELDLVFCVMAIASHHVFQILTKRSDRMRAYIEALMPRFEERMWATGLLEFSYELTWPLANVWLGVSVEDQARADERIPDLLATHAAVRWISAEPLLGPIKTRGVSADRQRQWDWLTGQTGLMHPVDGPDFADGPRIDWVVVGGESGPGARPMHPDWAREIRDQCAAAAVPFLFKQWGTWREVLHTEDGARVEDVDVGSETAEAYLGMVQPDQRGWVHADGRTFYGHPDNLPDGAWRFVERIGKKAAGRHLDGMLHDGYPT